jgi:hypothetical protein
VSGVALSRLDLDQSRPLRRNPPRPLDDRQPDYERKFDGKTVFYDCFASRDGAGPILIGPPLLNLESVVVRAIRRAFQYPWWWRRSIVRRLDRASIIRLRLKTPQTRADFEQGLFVQSEIVVQPNEAELFRGSNVLVTKSRHNEAIWIRDWVRFYAAKHGADAVLLYDNSDAGEDTEAIAEAIRSVPGIRVSRVVPWPFPFGPDAGPRQVWDSDFCQYGVLEHARWRFLSLARAVVNADIDELVITATGQSVFDVAVASATGYLCYDGRWVENATIHACGPRRHMHYRHAVRGPVKPTTDKWTVVPARTPPDGQWLVHVVDGMTPDKTSKVVSTRHFRAINTNWRFQRWVPERPDERDHVLDHELASWLDVFHSEPTQHNSA